MPFSPSLRLAWRIVALCGIGLPPLFAQDAPWQQYLGANTAAGFSSEPWRATVRSGYPRGSNNAAISSTIDPARLDEVLAAHDWVHLQDGYNYRQQADVDAFFNAIRADHGAAWRANVLQLAEAMIDGMQRNSAGGHRALGAGQRDLRRSTGTDHRHLAQRQQPAVSAPEFELQRQPDARRKGE